MKTKKFKKRTLFDLYKLSLVFIAKFVLSTTMILFILFSTFVGKPFSEGQFVGSSTIDDFGLLHGLLASSIASLAVPVLILFFHTMTFLFVFVGEKFTR